MNKQRWFAFRLSFPNEKETKHLEHVYILNSVIKYNNLLRPTNTRVFSRNTKTLLPVSNSPTSSPPGAPPGPPPSPPPFGSGGPIQSCRPRFSPSVPIPAGPTPTACVLSSGASGPSLDGSDACFTAVTPVTSIPKRESAIFGSHGQRWVSSVYSTSVTSKKVLTIRTSTVSKKK